MNIFYYSTESDHLSVNGGRGGYGGYTGSGGSGGRGRIRIDYGVLHGTYPKHTRMVNTAFLQLTLSLYNKIKFWQLAVTFDRQLKQFCSLK